MDLNYGPALQNDEAVDRNRYAAKDFATFQHGYLREYTALADRKASFIFTMSSAVLAYLISNKALAILSVQNLKWNIHHWIGLLAFAGLLGAIGLALHIVSPRLRKTPKDKREAKGVIFWEDVARHDSAEEYASKVLQLSSDETTKQLLEHCYIISDIATEKYRYLRYAAVSLVIGVLSAIFFLVWPYL